MKYIQLDEIMKKEIFRILSAAALGLALMLAGCSKDSNGDVAELLKTVPADAGTVVAVNAQGIAEKAGCKVKDGKMELPPAFASSLASMNDASARKKIEMLLDGESGVEITSFVVFQRGYHTYLTGLLSDPGAFKSFLKSSDAKYDFKDTDGIECAADMAIKGNQFWSRSVGNIDPLDVKEMAELPENRSFFSTGYAERLTEGGYDVRGLLDMAKLSSGGVVKQAQTQMALQTVFSDAAYLGFSIEFKKGEADVEAAVLTSGFKPAKCNFPLAKIDTDAVKTIAATGNEAIAIGASDKLVEKVSAMLSQTGALGKIYNQIIAPVNGTVAVLRQAGLTGEEPRMAGFVQTTGKDLNPLASVITQAGMQWKLDGGKVVITTPQPPQGAIGAEEFAKECKGASIVYMADGSRVREMAGNDRLPLKRVVVKAEPSEGSIKVTATVEATDSESNILMTVLEAVL